MTPILFYCPLKRDVCCMEVQSVFCDENICPLFEGVRRVELSVNRGSTVPNFVDILTIFEFLHWCIQLVNLIFYQQSFRSFDQSIFCAWQIESQVVVYGLLRNDNSINLGFMKTA